MSERHGVIPRTMCFIFCNDKLLLMKASSKKAYPGIHNPLGGHIEKGEDIIACANREILEESGIRAKNTRLRGVLHVTNFFGKNIMLFITTSTVPSEISCPPHEEGTPEWIPLAQLDRVQLFDDLKPIIQTLLDQKDDHFFTGTSRFDDSGKLLQLSLQVR